MVVIRQCMVDGAFSVSAAIVVAEGSLQGNHQAEIYQPIVHRIAELPRARQQIPQLAGIIAVRIGLRSQFISMPLRPHVHVVISDQCPVVMENSISSPSAHNLPLLVEVLPRSLGARVATPLAPHRYAPPDGIGGFRVMNASHRESPQCRAGRYSLVRKDEATQWSEVRRRNEDISNSCWGRNVCIWGTNSWNPSYRTAWP